jgi:Sortase domain
VTGVVTPGEPAARRRPIMWALLVVSAAVLVTPPVWWGLSRAAVDVGSLPAVQRAPLKPEARLDTGEPAVPPVAVRSARLSDRQVALPGARPIRVRIGAIGVRAAIVPVGIDARTGFVRVPADVRTVGWYRYGPTPGQGGSSVLVGHVDSHEQGPGAFFRLRDVAPAASLEIQLSGGRTVAFTVVARRLYGKAALPAGIFREWGSPVLTLITCGGPFDTLTRHYADNVVLYAVPRH